MFKSIYRRQYRSLFGNLFGNDDLTLPIIDSSLKVHLQSFGLGFSKDDLMTTDGSDFVSQWNGINGTNIDVTQSTQTEKPKYIDNLINGRPALNFDGVNDQLTNTTNVPDFSVVTVFIVGEISTSANRALVELSNGAANTGMIIFFNGTLDKFTFRIRDGTTNNVELTETFPIKGIFTGIGDGTNATFRTNGLLRGTTPALSMPEVISRLDIGGLAPPLSFPLDGPVGEVIIYDRALFASEVSLVEIYLSEKWKINLA